MDAVGDVLAERDSGLPWAAGTSLAVVLHGSVAALLVVSALQSPVRFVVRPEKPSLPYGVASMCGAISSTIRAIVSPSASWSTTTAASRSSTSCTSCAAAVQGR